MRKAKRRVWVAAGLGFALAWTALSLLSQQQCLETTGNTQENFDSVANIDLTQSSAKFWCQNTTGPQNIVTLNLLGANFTVSNPVYVPSWINILTANDFDLDGWTDYVGCSSEYSSALVFVKNMGIAGRIGTFQIAQWIDGSRGDADNVPIRSVGGAALESMIYPGITSGDYDGDGDYDFLYAGSDPYGPTWRIRHIWLYRNTLINNGIRTGILNFVQTDLTSNTTWRNAIAGFAWGSTDMVSIDFDGDGDIDVLVGNYKGELRKLTNTNNRQVNASTFIPESTPVISTGWGGRGLSTVSVADFDGANGLDIFLGSVSYRDARFYKNDGTGRYTLAAQYYDTSCCDNDDRFDGAATVSICGDFDQDGDVDLVFGTDYANYGTNNGGKAYFFRNSSGTFTTRLIFNGQLQRPQVYDFDLGAALDYDNDGDVDFIIADGNHTQSYYVFTNTIAPVYNLQGMAVSKNLTSAIVGEQGAITRVRIKQLLQGIKGSSAVGLGVTYYVSNDDGQTWELYADFSASAIKNANDQDWHDFKSFGTSLRWKAVFRAAEDVMRDYDDASYETPYIARLDLEYIVVAKREYSRTAAVAANLAGSGGQTIKSLIAATFYFPSFEGRLRAYDVTQMTCAAGSESSLRTVSTTDLGQAGGRSMATGVSILWDAGELLKARSANDRTIWTVLTGAGGTWIPTSFTAANESTLGPILQDKDGDNDGLIEFIRGSGRSWKLGDIQHSNPIVVGPPSGETTLMGIGYDLFVTANANRAKVVYAGANDGMLHAFEANTGRELWAFIPSNLLPKLKNLSTRDASSGRRQLQFDYFVDGSPVAADVKIGGVWKTVLVCGQGKGKGTNAGSGQNYYFALDVTSPSTPLFLWQTTDPTMGETWSVPAIGKVMVGSAEEWVAFAGSGYDNDGTSAVLGNQLNAIRIRDGAILQKKAATNVDTSRSGRGNPFTDIPNAMPGSPVAADPDADGFVESVYIGDLDGRLWKLDVTNANSAQWTMTAIYTDANNFPIITKPALWIDTLSGSSTPHLYFGTGGDDAAPANRSYAFIALLDEATPSVEWYVGDFNVLNLPREKSVDTTQNGEKFWADPVIADNIVYFSLFTGSIENVNPCLNLGDLGKLFGRYTQAVGSTMAGGSALRTSLSGTVASLTMASKARQAVTIGERQRVAGTNKREVYAQQYDSTIERLEQPVGALLQIRSWREIFKIIRIP